MERDADARRTALAVVVLLGPFLLVGTLTTLSIFGAVFGVPLLIVTVPPAVVAVRARRLARPSPRGSD